MDYSELRRLRGLSDMPKRSLLDFMGKDELAANLFRLALTEGRVKKEQAVGQNALERVAKDVGRRVRRTMHERNRAVSRTTPKGSGYPRSPEGAEKGSRQTRPD